MPELGVGQTARPFGKTPGGLCVVVPIRDCECED
jgi:hypothetical protein